LLGQALGGELLHDGTPCCRGGGGTGSVSWQISLGGDARGVDGVRVHAALGAERRATTIVVAAGDVVELCAGELCDRLTAQGELAGRRSLGPELLHAGSLVEVSGNLDRRGGAGGRRRGRSTASGPRSRGRRRSCRRRSRRSGRDRPCRPARTASAARRGRTARSCRRCPTACSWRRAPA